MFSLKVAAWSPGLCGWGLRGKYQLCAHADFSVLPKCLQTDPQRCKLWRMVWIVHLISLWVNYEAFIQTQTFLCSLAKHGKQMECCWLLSEWWWALKMKNRCLFVFICAHLIQKNFLFTYCIRDLFSMFMLLILMLETSYVKWSFICQIVCTQEISELRPRHTDTVRSRFQSEARPPPLCDLRLVQRVCHIQIKVSWMKPYILRVATELL